jgi:hypothetical protein
MALGSGRSIWLICTVEWHGGTGVLLARGTDSRVGSERLFTRVQSMPTYTNNQYLLNRRAVCVSHSVNAARSHRKFHHTGEAEKLSSSHGGRRDITAPHDSATWSIGLITKSNDPDQLRI